MWARKITKDVAIALNLDLLTILFRSQISKSKRSGLVVRIIIWDTSTLMTTNNMELEKETKKKKTN